MGSSISELLDDLQKIPEGEQEKLKAWCDSLCKFYELNVRHSYADITEYIISHDGGVEYTEKILPVLEKMRENLKQEKNVVQSNVGKLIDHIRLEIFRIRYIDETLFQNVTQKFIDLNNEQFDNFSSLHRTMQKDLEELEQKNQEIKEAIEKNRMNQDEIDQQIQVLEQTATNAANKVENAQNEIIAILGIFAAIVLAFVSGIAFSTSVLQNIANASIYKILFISCGIVLVLTNLIYMLLRFILEIKDKNTESRIYPGYLKKMDCFFIAIAGLTVLFWFFDLEQIAAIFRNRLYH